MTKATLSLEQMLKQRREKVDAEQASSIRAAKLPSGTSQIRIMPSWREGDPTFFHEYGQHFIKKDGAIKAVHVKQLEDAKGGRRVVMNAIIRGQNDDKPQLIEMAKYFFDTALLPVLEEYFEELLSLKDGLDLIVTQSGSGQNTKYMFQPASKRSNKPNVPESVMKDLMNIDAFVKQENEAGAQRAIATVAEVAGISAPTKHIGGPKLSAPKVDDGLEGLLEGEAEEVFEEVPEEELKSTGTGDSTPAQSSAPINTTTVDDLDDLLGDL